MAEVLSFGRALRGLNQVHVWEPGVAPGPSLPVQLKYLRRPSNEVTIAL